MLNRSWKTFYDEKDWNEWSKLKNTTPITYDFQFKILRDLLNKYYRTESGSRLNPNTERSTAQVFKILEKTMNELAEAVSRDEEAHKQDWEEQQQRDLDPEDIRIMQDELRRDSNMNISIREAVLFGPAWENFEEHMKERARNKKLADEAYEEKHKHNAETEDDQLPEISIREAANIMLDKEGTRRYQPDSAYDKTELKTGISDEKSEHANPDISAKENTEIATEIAKDHLEKNKNYYTDMEEAGID